MSPILLAVVLFGVLMLLLALFAGRGAGETAPARASPAPADLSLAELAKALREAFLGRGYALLSETVEPERAELLLRDPSPLTGQTIAVFCLAPADQSPVDSVEVQAALDRVHGDQLEKAIVATPGDFTGEARLLAQGANVELLDGAALERLLARPAVPEVPLRGPAESEA